MRSATLIARATLALALSAVSPALVHASEGGFVYVMTNADSGNSVIQFRRDAAGSLTAIREVYTGGLGTGGTLDPLRSQHSLVLNAGGTRLVAVNAGSNDVSVLAAGEHGLAELDRVPSGGEFPSSAAISGNLVYVLNAHGTPGITGFRMTRTGKLEPLAGSRRDLPGGPSAGPTDVRFTPDGTQLWVTETATNHIDVFEVEANGLTRAALTVTDPGVVPFGIVFADDVALVVEPGSASLSSFAIDEDGAPQLVSAAVPDGQKAACWVSVAPSGRWAYVSNTGSRTLATYHVSGDGALTLANATAAATGDGSAPIDSALTRDGSLLYVVDSTLGRILAFHADGATLTPADEVAGLPTSLQGIAAR